MTAEDVLWRRTKRGLVLTPEQAADVEAFLREHHARRHSQAAE
jgi:glycerol-3-phosphate dehydrogenase